MNFSQKLKLYRYWDEKQVDENDISKCDFENAYKNSFWIIFENIMQKIIQKAQQHRNLFRKMIK